MQPFLVMLEVEIFESNLAIARYSEPSGFKRVGFATLYLHDIESIFYNSHLRSVIPDLVTGTGHRTNKIELVLTSDVSKALGFEEVGKRV